ncbi:hypothetical protein [Bacillus paramycoides]|nr:hypothetical protein [Bacillus paramycoides]MED0981272.1 hypothetical protein [Bacillus paramycoides]MED0984756.1 hypothetical protein [Bacillus paramycoides]MED1088694.1 hypothetical protein [Bacillus paramycoides]
MDLIGHTFFTLLQIPADVFTSAIGAQYFIYFIKMGIHKGR